MIRIIRNSLVVILSLAALEAAAKVKVLGHYNFGRIGNITFAAVPTEISPVKDGMKLTSASSPLFFADAPGQAGLKGEGSILFDGKSQWYSASGTYGTNEDNFLMEIWAKPVNQTEEDRRRLQIVAANGDGGSGYMIGLTGGKWVLHTGGSGAVDFGESTGEQWVHLAVVKDGENHTLWMNGRKVREFYHARAFNPNFAIGGSGKSEKEAFRGLVYEVRFSTFATGAFNPDSDFLIDYKVLKEQNRQRAEERAALISAITSPGLGKQFVDELAEKPQEQDWLITQITEPCKLMVEKPTADNTVKMRLENGLVSRTFYVSENLACVGFKNLSNDAEYLRAVKPEARLEIDHSWYEIGGLKGQPEQSYLLEDWYGQLENSNNAFVIESVETGEPITRYPWHQRYNAKPTPWPALGLRVTMTYKPAPDLENVKDIKVKVNYEIYQGLPVVSKWVEVVNNGDAPIELNKTECEVLAVNQDQIERIHVESTFSFALVNANPLGSALMHYSQEPNVYEAGKSTTLWSVDYDYHTWATHNQAEDNFLGFPHRNLLISRLPIGPDVLVADGETFTSFITFEMLQDSDDRERKSLGHRRFYKKLAPQTTESLLAGAITSHDEEKLKGFIDQMAELGMERLDIHPWPGVEHSNLDPEYTSMWRRISDYAGKSGIVMGGYELHVSSRGRGSQYDCVSPVTGEPGCIFGQSVCLASDWKDVYYGENGKMWEFYDKTGFKTYNMDGPYHGDVCAATNHKHHRGILDSQWEQWKTQTEVIKELMRRDVYVPIPDWYFLNGQSATGMGYREATANLSPEQQLLLGRQYIYDGTWHKMPTMGWMTLQLVGFYTRDARVGLEPLCENLDAYERQLVQFLGSGAQLTIRGDRIYDTPETKVVVKKRIDWFKKYRDILTSDIIHVSRPTGRDIDCMMHVNPELEHKGMVVVFNPTGKEISKDLKLPLYYTGLKGSAKIKQEEGSYSTYKMDENHNVYIPVKIPANGYTWYVIE